MALKNTVIVCFDIVNKCQLRHSHSLWLRARDPVIMCLAILMSGPRGWKKGLCLSINWFIGWELSLAAETIQHFPCLQCLNKANVREVLELVGGIYTGLMTNTREKIPNNILHAYVCSLISPLNILFFYFLTPTYVMTNELQYFFSLQKTHGYHAVIYLHQPLPRLLKILCNSKDTSNIRITFLSNYLFSHSCYIIHRFLAN